MIKLISIFLLTQIIFPLLLSCSDSTLTDIDGNVYKTVKIGNQVWMAENLKVTHYRNGDLISNVFNRSEWKNLKNGAYCSYNNNANNVEIYGLLYNWYAVEDKRNIAPNGWHVPTNEDWKELDKSPSKKLKTTNGWASDGNGTNESGFTALPGGCRNYDGSFADIGYNVKYWSSTEYQSYYAWNRLLIYSSPGVNIVYNDKQSGFSVRLVRD